MDKDKYPSLYSLWEETCFTVRELAAREMNPDEFLERALKDAFKMGMEQVIPGLETGERFVMVGYTKASPWFVSHEESGEACLVGHSKVNKQTGELERLPSCHKCKNCQKWIRPHLMRTEKCPGVPIGMESYTTRSAGHIQGHYSVYVYAGNREVVEAVLKDPRNEKGIERWHLVLNCGHAINFDTRKDGTIPLKVMCRVCDNVRDIGTDGGGH